MDSVQLDFKTLLIHYTVLISILSAPEKVIIFYLNYIYGHKLYE